MAGEESRPGIEAEVRLPRSGIGTVARETGFRQNGTDLPIEEFDLRGSSENRKHRGEGAEEDRKASVHFQLLNITVGRRIYYAETPIEAAYYGRSCFA